MIEQSKWLWWRRFQVTIKGVDRLWLFRFNKRQRFVFATVVVGLVVLLTQTVPGKDRLLSIAALGVVSYLFTVWALHEDFAGVEYLTLTFLPVAFTIASASAYFLLPVRWLTRLPIAIAVALSFYSLLLTENIFNVAAIRTIQLLRAAHTVGYFFTLVTAFLLFDVLFALHLSPWWMSFGVAGILFPLVLVYLWSLDLTKNLSEKYYLFSGVLSLSLAQIAWSISFWPMRILVASLFLVTCLYAFLGIVQHYFQMRLNRRTALEYILVGVVVFFIVLVTTRWGVAV